MDTIVADVWLVDPADAHEPALVSRYLALISAAESARYDRLRVDTARHRYLVSRVLVRTVLAARLDMAPADVVLRTTSSGRPELAAPGDRRRLDFNLSHTDGLIVLAVTDAAPIGVDVERYDRDVDVLALAQRFFAPEEHAAIVAADESRRRGLFITYWTLKEAFLKARGVGIAGGLDSIAFSIDADENVHLLAVPDDDRSWRFASWQPTTQHRATVAARAAELELRVRRVVPLAHDGSAETRVVKAH
jgi:4'-phosphopantetheinyl transferase